MTDEATQELEADAKVKKMRKERENRKKQHAMTLEETREQIVKEKNKLSDLTTQKHDLVQQLKKVLKDHEQKQQQQQQNYMKESELMPIHPYATHNPLTISGHPQILFPSAMVPARAGNISTLYKVGVPTTQPLQNIIPSGSLKRSRTPTPPPSSQPTYQQIPYVPVFKGLPGSQNSIVPVTLTTAKSTSGASVYLSSQPYYHGSQAPHGSGGPYTATSQPVVGPYLTTSIAPSQPPRDEKHMPLYQHGGRAPVSLVSTLHQTLDHKGNAAIVSCSGSVPPFPTPPVDVHDKFYVSGVRPHLVLQTLPGQQLPLGGGKGSITTGFPLRSSASTNPPHTVPSTIGHSYSGHQVNMNRNYF